jgi:hypothetical protein
VNKNIPPKTSTRSTTGYGRRSSASLTWPPSSRAQRLTPNTSAAVSRKPPPDRAGGSIFDASPDMRPELIIGIDAGASGGIAWQYAGGMAAVEAMPATEGEVIDLLRDLALIDQSTAGVTRTAYIEKVGGYIAGRPAPGSRMFNFGRNYGLLMGGLIASGYRIEEVTPQSWMKTLGLNLPSTLTRTARKNKLKERARQLFPAIGKKITLKTADALLILEAGRRLAR